MILVVGGTGRLGRLVVPRLVEQGDSVRVLTRRPESASELSEAGAEVIGGDLRDPASVVEAVAGTSTVVAAAHGLMGPRGESPASVDDRGNAVLVDAARRAGADVVLLSVVGAAADHPMELFRAKFAAERALHDSGVPAVVVRATAFAELWIDMLRETASRGGRPLVFGRGTNPVNFVSVADVAAVVVRAVQDRGTRRETFEVGGPADLTFNALAALVQAADGRDGPPRHVPRAALRVLGRAGLVAPQLARLARAGLAMDTVDLTFDAAGPRARLPGTPFTPVAALLRA